MFSNKSLRNLIIPLIIEQFLAVTIGIADTVMVSSCGEAAVSGISLVDSVNFLLITIFTALATGGAVVSAQYLGKGSRKDASEAARQLLYSIVALSLVITLITIVFRDTALRLIFGAIDPDVMANAQTYFLLSALSYPFLAVFNAGAALFRSMGDSKTSMLTSVLMNVINVAGNAIFIFGFQWGVFGAALASLISRIVGAVLITVLLMNPNRQIFYENLHRIQFKMDYIRKILYIGIPTGVENSIFQIGKILVASIIAGFGTVAITANAIAGNLASIQIIPGSAIGMAMVTVIGQCVGAKDFDNAKRYTKKMMILAYLCMWGFTGLLALLLNPILSAYSLSPETMALTTEVFMVHGICALVIWAPAFALPNALRAAGDVKFTMWSSLVCMWLFRIGFSYVLAIFFNMGVLGIWVAMCIDWLVRSVLFVGRFLKGKWIKKGVV